VCARFVNAVYLYDGKIILTFNYKEGCKTISFGDIMRLNNATAGSDVCAAGAPAALEAIRVFSAIFSKQAARVCTCSLFVAPLSAEHSMGLDTLMNVGFFLFFIDTPQEVCHHEINTHSAGHLRIPR